MKSKFWKKVSQVTLGTVISQAIAISGAPILSRLYTPESFGTLGTFVSIVSVASILAKFGYDRAIMVIESRNLVNLLLLILLVIVCLNSMIIAVATSIFEKDLGFYLIFTGILILSLVSVMDILFSRFSLFKELSFLKIFRSITVILTQVALSFKTLKYGLIVGMLCGNLVTLLVGYFTYLKRIGFKLKRLSLKLVKILLFGLSDFPKYGVWGSFLNALSLSSVILLMGFFFPKSVVGYFFLTYRLLQVPLALIGQSIGLVFFQEFSSYIREKNLIRAKNLFLSLEKKLALIGILPFGILTVFGDKIVVLLLGKEWYTAGVYLQLLSISGFFNFIASPLSSVFASLRLQSLFFASQIFFLILRGVGIIISGIFDSDMMAVAVLGIINFTLYLGFLLYIHKFVLHLRALDIFKNTFIFMFALMILYVLRRLGM